MSESDPDFRLRRDVADSYDEELELELEDRPFDAHGNEIPLSESEKQDRRTYFRELLRLQGELVRLQDWVMATGHKMVVLFEGRDAAGKGGVIKRITQRLNPRVCRVVALPAPNDRERTQWYFQRYASHLPAAGEIVLFDRSWYNRAGVEKVMGFASEDEVDAFLKAVPIFEKLLVDDGIRLFKYWLSCDQAQQEERFAERIADPLKRWKLSPIDAAARTRYADYSAAREAMFAVSHTDRAPWTVVDFNDQKRGRLTLIRNLLDRLPDTDVPEEPIEWPALDHPPLGEDFGMLAPIPACHSKK